MSEYLVAGGIRGWGQMLDEDALGMPVVNRARYGSTASSFLGTSWPGVVRLAPAVVLFQFGHNPESAPRESIALSRMFSDCRRWGARPILVTQMADRDVHIRHPELGNLFRRLSRQEGIPLIALDSLTSMHWRSLSRTGRESLFVDGIHLSQRGASLVASLATQPLAEVLAGFR